ncbi:MAG: ADP-glyceromanno-heptose 6-epimerase [Oligoflexia bacterium]|nr:ADP-glyceromanno-heptose 6-epimerase [Oligoflexia bacterium]
MSKKVIITGAMGFIGSLAVIHHSRKGSQVLSADHQELFSKRNYLDGINCNKIDAEKLLNSFDLNGTPDLVIHLGAITNTAASDKNELNKWNVNYSKKVWEFCTLNKVPLIYASSAATYGSGLQGFSDSHGLIKTLRPLNLYGLSKHEFDLWALEQKNTPPNWYGLKFFNVYGPNETHKERMASSIWHGYNEIKNSGKMTLFKSHNPDYKDGQQARDFIFVNDILYIMDFLEAKKPASGIYNCGTGNASTFLDVAKNLFIHFKKPIDINWIDTPVEFRKSYQYKTQAEMTKLIEAGYSRSFTPLNEGVRKYLSSI